MRQLDGYPPINHRFGGCRWCDRRPRRSRGDRTHTVAVQQGQQGVGSQVRLFLQQVGRATVGLTIMEHRLDLSIETVLQPEHRLRIPRRGPATHPGVAIDPAAQPHSPPLPLQAVEPVTIGLQPSRLGAHGASELLRSRRFGEQHQPSSITSQPVAHGRVELSQRAGEDIDMITRHPPSIQRRPEPGHLRDGLGTLQHLLGLADAGPRGVSQRLLGERRHHRQPSSNSDLAALDPRLQPPQLTNRGLQHQPISSQPASTAATRPTNSCTSTNSIHPS